MLKGCCTPTTLIVSGVPFGSNNSSPLAFRITGAGVGAGAGVRHLVGAGVGAGAGATSPTLLILLPGVIGAGKEDKDSLAFKFPHVEVDVAVGVAVGLSATFGFLLLGKMTASMLFNYIIVGTEFPMCSIQFGFLLNAT